MLIQKNIVKYTLLIVFFSTGVCFSQNQIEKITTKGILEHDDPIASVLDSIQSLKLFECSGYSTDTCLLNTYNYSPNFVPYFDELTIESRLNKLDIKSPFDLTFNESVKHYIDIYTNKKRYDVSMVLGLSHLYFNLFEEQLDKYNLPLELKYLAIVESALNPCAISKTGAAGLWQFMLPTGKMFGLNVTSYIDERKDPYKSTLAACKYLKYLYGLFGDWQMVLAAYNSGPGTISKAIRRSGGKTTYWEIRPFLPKETQNYVPAFIAVNYAMNYSREHNLYPLPVKSSYFFADTVHVKQQVSFTQISAVIDMPIEEIRFLNPSYKQNYVPFDSYGSTLCLPSNKVGAFLNYEDAIYQYKQVHLTTKYIEKQLSGHEKYLYKVRSKETLQTIALKNNVSVAQIKKWNRLKKNSLSKGKTLVIYKNNINTVEQTDKASAINLNNSDNKELDIEFTDKNKAGLEDTTLTKQNDTKNKETYILHKVQQGDTLWNIANRYNGVSVEEIKRINNFNKNKKLKIGEKVKVPLT